MVTLNVNGRDFQVEADPKELLVWVIHEKIGLKSIKYGCGVEMCGACRVLVDGKGIFSCKTRVAGVLGKKIVTGKELLGEK